MSRIAHGLTGHDYLPDHLGLSSRDPGRASRPTATGKARAPRRAFRPSLQGLEDRCVPSTLVVTRGDDSLTQRGTLRWAVANAQNNDTIVLTGDAYRTEVTLTQGELVLTQQGLTIEGRFGVGKGSAGMPPATISGDHLSRIFEVAGGAQVTLSNLAITDGNGLADNPAGNATSDGQGGGVLVDPGAALTVSDSTLSGNSAYLGGVGGGGGGIFNYGTATVSGSTLSGNSATYGGGIYIYAGSGINHRVAVTVSNSSTIFGNSASIGADVFNLGVLYLDSSSMIGILVGFPVKPI